MLAPALATNRFPAASIASATGCESPVEEPEIFALGATLPVLPAPYSVIELAALFATKIFFVVANTIPCGEARPVAAPLIVRIGATLPLAFAA